MNKLGLIKSLQKKSNLHGYEAREFVRIFFDEIADTLARGDRVEIRGLCSFYVKEYETYIGRNPMTGVKVQVSAKKLPFFKCGKDLKERVNKRDKT